MYIGIDLKQWFELKHLFYLLSNYIFIINVFYVHLSLEKNLNFYVEL
jgi:hypothetical protein